MRPLSIIQTPKKGRLARGKCDNHYDHHANTLQYPPLAGPMRSIMPSALRLARCFSTALAEMPILSASAAALNLPFAASNTTIFPLLFIGFSPPFWVFSLLFLSFHPTLCGYYRAPFHTLRMPFHTLPGIASCHKDKLVYFCPVINVSSI